MSSSTSSSDPFPTASGSVSDRLPEGAPSPAPGPVSARKRFLRVFLVVVFGMAASLGLVRAYAAALGASGEAFLGRVLQARAALPEIVAEEEPLVMFYGSSMTRAGFSARVFDRELAERGVHVKSFNFGFGGLNPFFQDYLARRIREAFAAEGRELELTLIEFNPFQTTKTRYEGAVPAIDAYLGMLASPAEIRKIFLDDPARGARILTIHYLRDDVSAEMATWYFGEFLRPPVPKSDVEEDEATQKRLEEVGEALNAKFEEEYPDWDGAEWSYAWQGAGTIPSERSEETLELFDEYYALLRNDEKHMRDDLLWRVHSADILELHFEEELVRAFIRAVQELQQVSRRVEVVMLPRNTEWVRYSPEARARLDAVVRRIEEETGAPVRDFQTIEEVTPAMFGDTTHLARYLGDIPFTEFLVERYAPMLRGEGATPRLAAGEEPESGSSG